MRDKEREGGVPDQRRDCFQGGFFSLLFGLSFNSTGSLRFALAKCYKCFDNLVSDPPGSPGRARGYNGFTPRDLTKQHGDEYIHTCIHSPGPQMLVFWGDADQTDPHSTRAGTAGGSRPLIRSRPNLCGQKKCHVQWRDAVCHRLSTGERWRKHFKSI